MQIASLISFLKAKKYYVIIIGTIVLFFLLRLILLAKPNTELTYTVKRENLVDVVQISGTYTTSSQTQVNSPSNGVLDQVFVTNDQVVKKEDQLFHVQSSATVDQQKAAYAAYLAASSTLQADNATLYSLQSALFNAWNTYYTLATGSTYQNGDGSPNTSNRMLPAFTVPQDNWLAAEAQYKNQQAVIAKDSAALSSAQQTYNETQSVTVTAPIDGKVENFLSHVGDQVSAPQPLALSGTTLTSSVNPVLVLVGAGKAYLASDISEDYATRIFQGQTAYIVFDSLKSKTFRGTVESIANVGTTTQGVVSYNARVDVTGDVSLIKPNMTALITVETLRKNNVIDVPNSAIVSQNKGTFVQTAGSHRLIPVALGVKGIAKTEIINGLSAGTVIVAATN